MARVRCAGVLLDTRRGKRRELFAKKGGNTSLYPRPFRRTGVFLRDTAEPGKRRSNEEACLHICFFAYLASNANLRNVLHFSGLLYHTTQRMPANERAFGSRVALRLVCCITSPSECPRTRELVSRVPLRRCCITHPKKGDTHDTTCYK